jgi:hypothetical protein
MGTSPKCSALCAASRASCIRCSCVPIPNPPAIPCGGVLTPRKPLVAQTLYRKRSISYWGSPNIQENRPSGRMLKK